MTKDECTERDEMREYGRKVAHTSDEYPIIKRQERKRERERRKNNRGRKDGQTVVITPPKKQFR